MYFTRAKSFSVAFETRPMNKNKMVELVKENIWGDIEKFIKKYKNDLVLYGVEVIFLTGNKRVAKFISDELREKEYTFEIRQKYVKWCNDDAAELSDSYFACLNEYYKYDYKITDRVYENDEDASECYCITISVETPDNSDDSDYD